MSSKYFTEELSTSENPFVLGFRGIFPITRDPEEDFTEEFIRGLRESYDSSVISDGYNVYSPLDDKFYHCYDYHYIKRKHSETYMIYSFDDFCSKFKKNENRRFQSPVKISNNQLCDNCFYPVGLIVKHGSNLSPNILYLEKQINTPDKYVILKKRDGKRGSLAPNELNASLRPMDQNNLNHREKNTATKQMKSCKPLVKAFSRLLTDSFRGHTMNVKVSSYPLKKFIEADTGDCSDVSGLINSNSSDSFGKKLYRVACKLKGRFSKPDYIFLRKAIMTLDVELPNYSPDLTDFMKKKNTIFSKVVLRQLRSSSGHFGLLIRPRFLLSSFMVDRPTLFCIMENTILNSSVVSLRSCYVYNRFPDIENLRYYSIEKNRNVLYHGKSYPNQLYLQIIMCEGADEGAAKSNLSSNRHMCMNSRITPFDHPKCQAGDFNLLLYISLYESSRGMNPSEFRELVCGKKFGGVLKSIEDTVSTLVLDEDDCRDVTNDKNITGETLVFLQFRFGFRNDECHFEFINFPFTEIMKIVGGKVRKKMIIQTDNSNNNSPEITEIDDPDDEDEGEGDELVDEDEKVETRRCDVSAKIKNSGRVLLDTRMNERVKMVSSTPEKLYAPELGYKLKEFSDMLYTTKFRNWIFLNEKKPTNIFDLGSLAETIYSQFSIHRVFYDFCVHMFKNIMKNYVKFPIVVEQQIRYSLPEKHRNRFSDIFYKSMRKCGVIDSGIFVFKEGEVKVDRKLFHQKKRSNVQKLEGHQAKKFVGVKKWKGKYFKDVLKEGIEEEFRSILRSRNKKVISTFSDFRKLLYDVLFPYLELIQMIEVNLWEIVSKTKSLTDEEVLLRAPRLFDSSTIILAKISPFLKSLGRYVVYRNYPICLYIVLLIIGFVAGGSMSGVELKMGQTGIKGNYPRTMKGTRHAGFRNISFLSFDDGSECENNRWLNFIYTMLLQDVLGNPYLNDLYLNVEKYKAGKHVEKGGFIRMFEPISSLPEELKEMMSPNNSFQRDDDLERSIKNIHHEEIGFMKDNFSKISKITDTFREIVQRYDTRRIAINFHQPLPDFINKRLINKKNLKNPRLQLDYVMNIIQGYVNGDKSALSGLQLWTPGKGKSYPNGVLAIGTNHTELKTISFFFVPGVIISQWEDVFEGLFELSDEEGNSLRKVRIVVQPASVEKMKSTKFRSSVYGLSYNGGIFLGKMDFPNVMERNYQSVESISLLRDMVMGTGDHVGRDHVIYCDEGHKFVTKKRGDIIIDSYNLRRRIFTGSAILNYGKTHVKMVEFVFRDEKYKDDIQKIKRLFNSLERSAKKCQYNEMNQIALKLKNIYSSEKFKDRISVNLDPLVIYGLVLSEFIIISDTTIQQK